jgi:hypothetical protein
MYCRNPTVVSRRRPSADQETRSSEVEGGQLEEVHVASEPELKPERSLNSLRDASPASSSEAARFLETPFTPTKFEHFKVKGLQKFIFYTKGTRFAFKVIVPFSTFFFLQPILLSLNYKRPRFAELFETVRKVRLCRWEIKLQYLLLSSEKAEKRQNMYSTPNITGLL